MYIAWSGLSEQTGAREEQIVRGLGTTRLTCLGAWSRRGVKLEVGPLSYDRLPIDFFSAYLFLLLAELNDIKYSAYRTAMKLRCIQKASSRKFKLSRLCCVVRWLKAQPLSSCFRCPIQGGIKMLTNDTISRVQSSEEFTRRDLSQGLLPCSVYTRGLIAQEHSKTQGHKVSFFHFAAFPR